MIIEIALGIVLAVVILAALPAIFVLGAYALGIAALLAVAVGVIYLAFTQPFIAGIVALVGVAAYFEYRKHPPIEPTDAPTTIRLRQDDAERASSTKQQGSKSVPWPIAIKQAATILLLVLAVLAGWLIYVSTSEQLFAVAISVACAAVLFAPLIVLDWIRARKKKTPPGSPCR